MGMARIALGESVSAFLQSDPPSSKCPGGLRSQREAYGRQHPTSAARPQLAIRRLAMASSLRLNPAPNW
jgi:hypothetical protein